VAIPGFYDDVLPLDDTERAELAALPFDAQRWMNELGIGAATGEVGYTTLERMWARPTLDINGLVSGFAGDGFKTVLPATAVAKLSMRLVPDQDPRRVGDLLEEHIVALTRKHLVPGAVTVTLTRLHGGRPWSLPRESPFLAAAERAFAHAFGCEPVLTREGGSNPIVSIFEDALAAPTILFGVGLPCENPHAPDEHLHLDNFRCGTRAAVQLYRELAKYSAECNSLTARAKNQRD
jgi:acetylornithine deacetylase/succinyl-diaminopimelate desuccinylase-like protein